MLANVVGTFLASWVEAYPKRLVAVIAAKGASPKY